MSRKPRVQEALVRNANDEKQVADATRREHNERLVQLNDVRALLDLPQGRRFLWRLLEQCRVWRTPFDADERYTVLNIGKGDIGRFVLTEITDARPTALVELMTQHAPAFADAPTDEEEESTDVASTPT